MRVEDPLGFPSSSSTRCEHVERLPWRYDLHTPGALVRIDHFNLVTPDVRPAVQLLEGLGFRVSEDIEDDQGPRTPRGCSASRPCTTSRSPAGAGPRLHHVAFATHEQHKILAICDKLGALRQSTGSSAGPGRHGVSNAFYLYLRDPDGHRSRSTPSDYYTGDPDNPVVHLGRARQPAPRLVGQPGRPVLVHRGLHGARPGRPPAAGGRADGARESDVTIGADGFSYTRPDDEGGPARGFKVGNQV